MSSLPRAPGILFLDDEHLLVELAARFFEPRNYAFTGFTDADDALDAFRRTPDRFAWAVIDLNMPGRSGLDVARELIAIRPDTAIVLCSGVVTEGLEDAARGAGIRAVYCKPLDIIEMYSALDRLFATAEA